MYTARRRVLVVENINDIENVKLSETIYTTIYLYERNNNNIIIDVYNVY